MSSTSTDRTEPPDLPDYDTKKLSEELAAQIQAYWHGKGFKGVRVQSVQRTPTRFFDIRSNLVNGLPRLSTLAVAA